MFERVSIWTSVAAVCSLFAVTSMANAAPAKPTYTKDVLPILQENCQVCHRDNGANLGGMVAPMAFSSYEETRPWAKSMAKHVSAKTMPPWHAASDHHGVFANERTLTQDDIDTIVAWASSGAPRGNPADAPAVREWSSGKGWTIGEPDLVFDMGEEYFVGDDVEDIYVDFRTEITKEMLPEDRIIKAVEFRPGSSVVHHIIAMPLGGIAPGNEATVYPDDIGRRIGPGTNVTWQMHYHKEPGPGTGVMDRSQVAIKFYPKDTEVKYELKGEPLGRFDFRIPADDANYSIKQEFTFDMDSQIVSLMPHMHLRGKSALYEAYYPDGSQEVLLDVPRYDFNWQTAYRFEEFKQVPKGTKVVLTTAWDNSADNEFNPDPTQTVGWGHPTTDEMSFGFMSYINDSKESRSMFGGGGRRRSGGGGGRGFDLAGMIKQFDTNEDGLLQKDEAPERMAQFFGMIDSNGDEAISVEEATEAAKRLGGNRGRSRRGSQ
jgi:mono/diheme cytochrome c family protein